MDGMNAGVGITGAKGGLVVNVSLRSRSSPDVACRGSLIVVIDWNRRHGWCRDTFFVVTEIINCTFKSRGLLYREGNLKVYPISLLINVSGVELFLGAVRQVILVGVVLGWITGLNNVLDVGDARDVVKW